MIETQLGRRNLSPTQRITIAKKYEEKFRVEAKENISKAVTESNKNRANDESIHIQLDIPEIKETKVQKEIAKIANVGSGTVARYEVVMKSNDEEAAKF